MRHYIIFPTQLSKVLSQLLGVYRKQSKEVVEVRALYRKEAMQRKLLFNEVGVVIIMLQPTLTYPDPSHDYPTLTLMRFIGF